MKLTQIGEDIWTVPVSHRFFGIEIGGRMTAIRLRSGELFLHSPVSLNYQIRNDLDKLGKVKFVIAPNRFHHLFVGDYIEAYPDARIYAAPSLSEKRPELPIDGILSDESPSGWKGEIEQIVFEGVPLLNEVVFFHPKSRTVIFTDLVFNFGKDVPLLTKIFAILDGVYTKADMPRLIKYLMVRDREKARKSAEKILSWDFDRVILTHGEIVETNGKEAIRRAFGWF